MNLDDNQFNLENYIKNNIKLIYETLSINKSIFIIQSLLFNNIFQKLKDDDYPICSYENFIKFGAEALEFSENFMKKFWFFFKNFTTLIKNNGFSIGSPLCQNLFKILFKISENI